MYKRHWRFSKAIYIYSSKEKVARKEITQYTLGPNSLFGVSEFFGIYSKERGLKYITAIVGVKGQSLYIYMMW